MDSLNDIQKAPLNDSSSMMSYRLSSKSSRRPSLNDAPKSAMKDRIPAYSQSMRAMRTTSLIDPNLEEDATRINPTGQLKTPHSAASMPHRSARTVAGLNDISGPPLSSEGLMGMGGGYCVPLKSLSERNERTLQVDSSPLSTSERSNISNSRKSFRSARTVSSYYSDRGTPGSSLSGSISSIPTDVFDTYHDSMISHLGGRGGGSNRTNRSCHLSENGSDDSCSSYGTEDDDHSVHLDEMESSTRSGGVSSGFNDSWSIHNLAADQSLCDSHAATTLFPDRSQRPRTSIKMASTDVNNISTDSNMDSSVELMAMEGDNWDDEHSQSEIHLEDEMVPGRQKSLQVDELVPKQMRRISSLVFDESSMLEQSTKSISWEDESLGASYGASLAASHGPAKQSRRSSLTWDEDSIGAGHSSKKSLTWVDDNKQSDDSDDSLGDFAEASMSGSPFSLSKQDDDSDDSLGDFAQTEGVTNTTALREDSDSSLGDFSKPASPRSPMLRSSMRSSFARKEDSDSSLGDFAKPASPRSPMLRSSMRSSFSFNQGSDGSLGDFAGNAPSKSSLLGLKQGSDGSLGDFGGEFGSDCDDGSISEESDGLIRDDEIFKDALSHMAESTTPIAFQQTTSPMGQRRSVGDYTLSLSGKGENIPDIDPNERSITLGSSRRRSISSIPASALDASLPSRAISTISEDSFEITAEELGIYDHADGKKMKLAMMQVSDAECSFMSCSSGSSEEYPSSTEFYDEEDDKEKRVKEGLMWGLGTMGIGALVGWVVKLFRKSGEEDMDAIDLDTIHDELGQSIAQSALDESINFTGSEQLWGWASLGDGGASAELALSALHLPGTETAIISAVTGGTAPTSSAATAAIAATTNTMAVTAAGNVGAIAVTTTAVIGNSAIATGAGLGVSGAVSAAGAAGSGVMAALGLSGTGGSAAAVMGSTIGALAVAGTTYYSASGYNGTSVDGFDFANVVCPNGLGLNPNPDIQSEIFQLTIDVSGMNGRRESWGWMPVRDGEGVNTTSGDVLRDVWEEFFADAYNNVTANGCSELFERRVLDANLTATTHSGSIDGSESFLETVWSISVACSEICPSEPIFGTELSRMLPPVTEAPIEAPEILGTKSSEILGANSTKSFVSELDFRSLFETSVRDFASSKKFLNNNEPEEDDKDRVDVGNGIFIVLPDQEESPTEGPTEGPTEDPTNPTSSPNIFLTDSRTTSPTPSPTSPNIFNNEDNLDASSEFN